MSTTKKIQVAIIVLNWNGQKFLKDCLTSIFEQTYTGFDLYFVDNGSSDDSVKYVQKYFPQSHVIQNEKNLGYAGGNNVGIRVALNDRDVDYVLILNNDTLLEKNFLEEMIVAAEKYPKAGALAPKMKFFVERDVINSIGILIYPDGSGLNRGVYEKDYGQFDHDDDVFGVSGGSAFFHRDLLLDIEQNGEFFDEDFFAYFEDVDIAWRARLRGWNVVSVPRAVLYHIHSATSIAHSPFKSFYMNRNRFFVFIKNYPLSYVGRALWMTVVHYIGLVHSIRIKKGAAHHLHTKNSMKSLIWITVRGWGSVVILLPRMIRKRWYIQRRVRVSRKDVISWFNRFSAKREDLIYR